MPRRLPDRLTLGRRTFVLRRRLGMRGECYLATDRQAGPQGADRVIHVLRRTAETEQRLRVLRRLSHNNRNLPAILEHHPKGDRLFVVLPWLEGEPLRSFLGDSHPARRLPLFEALRLFHGFAHGLTQLHARENIVHGDLKPENLVVCRAPSRLVMIDFGSAWTAEAATTRLPGDGNDAFYAAPELQKPDVPGDFRSDQFSASIIFYEMLTRQLPFDGVGGKAGLKEFAEYRARFVPPSELCPERNLLGSNTWAAIDAVVSRGLQFDPDARHANRRQWLAALDDIKFSVSRSTRLDGDNTLLARVLRWLNDKFPERPSRR